MIRGHVNDTAISTMLTDATALVSFWRRLDDAGRAFLGHYMSLAQSKKRVP